MATCLAAEQRILGFVRQIIGKMTIEEAEHREYNFKVHFILDELDQLDERLTSHDVQRLIGLGIKFIPTPRPTSVSKFMESFEKLLFRLIRKVMADDTKDKFAREDKELAAAGIRPLKLEMFPYPMAEIRDRIVKFWGSQYWQRRIPSGFKMHMLELEKMFRKAATQVQCNLACERRRTNLAYRLREALRFLRSKKMLVNSVDKNLGSALISRSRSNEQNRLHILGPVRPPERQGPEVQELRLDQDNVAYVGISKTKEEIFEDMYMELRDILTQFHSAVSGVKSLFDRFLRYVQDCQKHGLLCSAYVIFKVHKPPNAMGIQSRPIAAQRAYPTRVVSQFLHDQFCELVMKHPHVLKDTKDLVRLLARGKPNSQGNILETGDVVALYPSIPHDLGLRALEWFMQTQFEANAKHLIPWLLRLTKFVLENNFVECKDIHGYSSR